MAFLEVNDLRKQFGGTEVLKGISFSLEQGEALSVIGASGNGKTTLLRCLNFLETADGGSITVDGKQIFPADKKSGNGNLSFGLVFQNFNLFPQYSVLKNVTLPMDMLQKRELKAQKTGLFAKRRIYKAAKAENEKKAMELLDCVGLAGKAQSYLCELSGGQSQRVAIARALALSPDILCFDEPTSALDPELTAEVIKVIKKLRTLGKTMIVVTHEMELAKSVSDKVLFLNNGVAELFGRADEVFSDRENEALAKFLTNPLEECGNL